MIGGFFEVVVEVVEKCILYWIINYIYDLVFVFYSFYNVEKVIDFENKEKSCVCLVLMKVM